MEFSVITENITITKLKASEGMTLTNGDVFGKEIYLGKGDSADNWYEISDEEAERIRTERDKDNELLSVDS